jgi:chorismate dehydratase
MSRRDRDGADDATSPLEGGPVTVDRPSPAVRIGAVSYLNTLPLVHGLERRGLGRPLALSFATPAVLAERLASGHLDLALLPIVELARIPDLEVVPGLAIGSHGPCRSVLLVSRRPAGAIRTLALDPASRTSNVLCRVLLDRVWGARPEVVTGDGDLATCLQRADAAVRIGDKALFDPKPADAETHDLGEVWTRETGLPFVFAVWAARPGIVDRTLYRVLHDSRREGGREIESIARAWRWNGEPHPDLVRSYLTEHIRFRLGAGELQAMELFFTLAHQNGWIDACPRVHLALVRPTGCDETAERLGVRRVAGSGRR